MNNLAEDPRAKRACIECNAVGGHYEGCPRDRSPVLEDEDGIDGPWMEAVLDTEPCDHKQVLRRPRGWYCNMCGAGFELAHTRASK